MWTTVAAWAQDWDADVLCAAMIGLWLWLTRHVDLNDRDVADDWP